MLIDVYKRQVIDPDDLEPGIYLTSKESTLLFTTGDGVSRGYGAVSYTHLDVYKRQCL